MIQQIYQLIDDFFEANIKVDISLTDQLVMPNFQINAHYHLVRNSKSSSDILCHMNLSRCIEFYNLKYKINIWLESNIGINIKGQDSIVELVNLNQKNKIQIYYVISQKWNSTSFMDNNNIKIVMEHKSDVNLKKLYLGTIIKTSLSRSVMNNYINIGFNNYLFAEQKILRKIMSENGKHCDQNIANELDNCYITLS